MTARKFHSDFETLIESSSQATQSFLSERVLVRDESEGMFSLTCKYYTEFE